MEQQKVIKRKHMPKTDYTRASKDETVLYMRAMIRDLVEKTEAGHPKKRLLDEQIGYLGRAVDLIEGKGEPN